LDHGARKSEPTPIETTVFTYGKEAIQDPTRLAALKKYMSKDAYILFGGCYIGANKKYCEEIAKATETTVKAATGKSEILPERPSDEYWRWYNDGEYRDFHPPQNPKKPLRPR
jgi:hypothetical protein